VELKIYEEEKKKKEVLLTLSKINTGSVLLSAVDVNGNKIYGGNILVITAAKGEVLRYANCCVPGIQTDKEGKIIIIKD